MKSMMKTDDYFSVEPIDNENGTNKEDQDVTGAATSSEVPPDEPVQKVNNLREKSFHTLQGE